MIALRAYQRDAIDRVGRLVDGGVRRVLVVSPTGSGKTVLAAELVRQAAQRGERTLLVAHRREIVNQTYDKLRAHGLAEAQVGVLMACDSRRPPGALVQVASVDTLRHRDLPEADIVVVDEAHRALAASYRSLEAAYGAAIHIGLTATPYRSDGKGLRSAYDELVVVTTARQLVADGFLVAPRVFAAARGSVDLRDVRVRCGDYEERALARAVNTAGLVGNIVEHWTKIAGNRRTVVFAVNIAHSRHIVDRFREAGVSAEHLDAYTPARERDAMLARLDRGETRVVSQCTALAEGWDQPSVKCAVLARPTRSETLYLQQAGRILRPWVDPDTGEPVGALLLDHAGCTDQFRLPQDDRVYSLDGDEVRDGSLAPAPTKRCPECGAVVTLRAATCEECGFDFGPHGDGVPAEADGELVEKTASEDEEERRRWAAYARLARLAEARGYKPGWAFHRYKARYGCEPPAFPPRTSGAVATEEEKRAFVQELRDIVVRRGYRVGFVFYRYKERFHEEPPPGWDAPLFGANDNGASPHGDAASYAQPSGGR